MLIFVEALCIYVHQILPEIFFFCSVFLWFAITIMLVLLNEFGNIYFLFNFWNNLRQVLNLLKMFGRIYPWSHLVLDPCILEVCFITNSISLLVISLFRFSISSWFSLARLSVFLNLTFFFFLGYSICCIIVHCSRLWFFVFLWCQLQFSPLLSDFIYLGPLFVIILQYSWGRKAVWALVIGFQFCSLAFWPRQIT